ncbi:hypothetical protein SAMN05446635_9903 [Burkholderia sp. OK233]|nr:hypothetical protein SAMN05446635_9903 [Burkholderia sp. OK233]
MRSIKTYGDAVVGKVGAMYSMALKPDLNSVQRRVVGYATRRRVRNLTKSPVETVAWGCAGHKRSGSGRLSRGISTDIERAEPPSERIRLQHHSSEVELRRAAVLGGGNTRAHVQVL